MRIHLGKWHFDVVHANMCGHIFHVYFTYIILYLRTKSSCLKLLFKNIFNVCIVENLNIMHNLAIKIKYNKISCNFLIC